MSLQTFLAKTRPAQPWFVAIARQRLLRLTRNGTGYLWDLTVPVADPQLAAFLHGTRGRGGAALTDVYICARLMSEGPKVFEPGVRTCEALENISLSVDGDAFHPPFPTFAIQLPTDFARKRLVPYTGGWDGNGEHHPDFVIVRHEADEGILLVASYFSSYQAISNTLRLDKGVMLEESWDRDKQLDGSLPMTGEERGLSERLIRLAVNVALMATNYGVRKLGYSNPEHAARLERRARKGGPHAAANREELAGLPVHYGFAQEVPLWRVATADEEREAREFGAGGWTTRPHWRRGHWRSQPYGPRGSLRKQVAIPAVLVNGHLLGVGAERTAVTYRE